MVVRRWGRRGTRLYSHARLISHFVWSRSVEMRSSNHHHHVQSAQKGLRVMV